MKSFNFYSPTKILFGLGSFEKAGVVGKEIGSRALIVCGKTAMDQFGFLGALKKNLSRSNIGFEVYSQIEPDPNSAQIDNSINQLNDFNPDLIIGLGGGSAIDAAKAIAVLFADRNSITDYLNGKELPSNTVPIIAIPTTAGTSSEMSKAAIITDLQSNRKRGLRGEEIIPKAAILDPELTLTLPQKVTAETGFDIMAHAIETFVSEMANPLTEKFSIEAIEIVKNNLPEALHSPKNLKIREKLLYACILMGFNLGNSSNCLPHRMQYPLGVLTKSSHQRGLASLYPAWIRETCLSSTFKFSIIYDIINGNNKLSELEKIQRLPQVFSDFLKSINLNLTISDLGVSEDQINTLVLEVEGNLKVDPGFKGEKTIYEIYKNSLANN